MKEIYEAIDVARTELNRLCHAGPWVMHIPVDLINDSDVILGNVIRLAREQADQLAKAEECLREIATKPHGAVRARKYLEGVEDEDT